MVYPTKDSRYPSTEPLGISATGFSRPDALPVTRALKTLKVLSVICISGHTSTFLHLPPDSRVRNVGPHTWLSAQHSSSLNSSDLSHSQERKILTASFTAAQEYSAILLQCTDKLEQIF